MTAADTLREAADKIENCGVDIGSHRTELTVHGSSLKSKQDIIGLLVLADDKDKIRPAQSGNTHWFRFRIGGMEMNVFFDPELVPELMTDRTIREFNADGLQQLLTNEG